MASPRYAATQTQQKAFGDSVLATLRGVPFGGLPKAELELALFRALVEAGILDPASPTFDLARQLEITPGRVRGLLYRYRLQAQVSDDEILDEITAALSRTRFELTAGSVTFGIEDPYLRDSFGALLKQRGIFPDTSFNPETVTISLAGFVDFVDSRLDPDDRVRILQALTHDTHVELSRFKRILKSTLSQLGKRLVGAAADEVASGLVDTAWELTSGLLGNKTGQVISVSARLP